jgi:AmmeMemoRadiSam system protein A
MNHIANATIDDGVRSRDVGRAQAVVCAVLLPHAPILVPAVGGARGSASAAAASTQAMRAAAAALLSYRPDSLVLISPHSPRKPGAYGLWADDRLKGSFEHFGAPLTQVSLPNDRRLANALVVEAQSRSVAIWSISNYRLDHGALVPLWFLAEAGWAGPTIILSLNYSDDGGLTSLGEAIAAAANGLHRRIGLVASGDMSHRLTTNAPCGFHPQAHQFDEMFIHLVSAGNYRELQQINPDLRELAAEDAVDSTLIAAAAVGWLSDGHRVLNYEGPFGVGYGVAILFAERTERARVERNVPATDQRDGDALPGVARQAVWAALSGSSEDAPVANGEYLSSARGVFVTVRRRNGKLRGCVGTLVPVCADLVAETWRNACLAALKDSRFSPITADELADLRFEVSVLHSIQEVAAADELDPRRYGVIVSTGDGRRGLLLPGIESIKSRAQQLRLARKKGWIDLDEPVTVQRFEVDHFEEPD